MGLKCYNKKFSIVKTLDFEKLNNEIDEYISATGMFDPYIFMNKDTADAMVEDVNPRSYPTKLFRNGVIGEFCGYKVFTNNDLKFGEIEIR